ncbi:hypothetical protein Talka_01658 [Tepidimonas alkaliphilus]|uniref:Uncharacterized protein n=2 Tax=Tepidimonas alkaliphilus TaxID=2588942 RepID=A0A554W6N8_9BURK|nr:hypothetical protein Talka_01658 [Tepidimonas alkaliphilus]
MRGNFKQILIVVAVVAVVATLALSLGILVFQKSSYGAGVWDFQGASGFAAIIPAVTGIFLACWAIYTQTLQMSAPFKAAEASLSNLVRLRYLSTLGIMLTLPYIEEARRREAESLDDEIDEDVAESVLNDSSSSEGDLFYADFERIRYFRSQFFLSGEFSVKSLFSDVAPLLEAFVCAKQPSNPLWLEELGVDIVVKIIDKIIWISWVDEENESLPDAILWVSVRMLRLINLFLKITELRKML